MRSLIFAVFFSFVALVTVRAHAQQQPSATTEVQHWATRPVAHDIAKTIYALGPCQVWLDNGGGFTLYASSIPLSTNNGVIDHVVILSKDGNGEFQEENFWRVFYDDRKIREIDPSLKTDVFWKNCGGKLASLPDSEIAAKLIEFYRVLHSPLTPVETAKK
jgi:hypothetical protein